MVLTFPHGVVRCCLQRTPGKSSYPLPPKKKSNERTPRATHCTDRAQTSTTVTGRRSPVDVLAAWAFVRTVHIYTTRYERKQTKKKHKYTCAYIVSVLCPVLQVSVFCSRNGLRVACRAGSTAVLQSISEWVSCSAGRCLLYTCCSTVIYSKYGRILQCDPVGL